MRDTHPYRAIPFRDSIAEGGIALICLFFIGYRAGIAEIPLLRGGYRTSTSHALQGGNAQKRGTSQRGGQNSGGGGQNLARMARRKPFLETLRKLFSKRSPEEILGVCKGLYKRSGVGGGGHVPRGGGSETVFRGGSPRDILPPPLPPAVLPPLWRPLGNGSLVKATSEALQCLST